ncbi:hypothetical protein D3C71_2080110 [compost metagenome]
MDRHGKQLFIGKDIGFVLGVGGVFNLAADFQSKAESTGLGNDQSQQGKRGISYCGQQHR